MTGSSLLGFDIQVTLLKERFHLSAELSSVAPWIAIVGPSGSGKSTLLRVLAGLELSAVGRVQVEGRLWLDTEADVFVPPWKRRVGYVAQDSLLIPMLSVAENLAFSGAAMNEVERIAEMFELKDLLHRRPRLLSGGERQRVALGRALLASPTLLLLDEPFSALDRSLRVRVTERLVTHCRERRLPMILISHDERDVQSLTQEVWEIENGVLKAQSV